MIRDKMFRILTFEDKRVFHTTKDGVGILTYPLAVIDYTQTLYGLTVHTEDGSIYHTTGDANREETIQTIRILEGAASHDRRP